MKSIHSAQCTVRQMDVSNKLNETRKQMIFHLNKINDYASLHGSLRCIYCEWLAKHFISYHSNLSEYVEPCSVSDGHRQ